MVDLKEHKIELETITKIQEEVLLNIGDRNAAEKRLVRKIDMRLMLMMMLICKSYASSSVACCVLIKARSDVLNYLDRNNIAAARLGSLEKDTHLVGTQYNTIIVSLGHSIVMKYRLIVDVQSVFFCGYILTQVPTNMILKKTRPSIFLVRETLSQVSHHLKFGIASCHVLLGYSFSKLWCCSKLWWMGRTTFPAWFCRSTVFP